MAINTKKVLVAGLAAGVLFVAVDMLTSGVLLGDRMAAELGASAPGALERVEAALPLLIALNVAFGILVALTYAAVRPRFGPGPRTGVIAGVHVWVIGTLAYSFLAIGGLVAWGTFAILSAIWLVAFAGGGVLAGWLYAEDAPAGATRHEPSSTAYAGGS
jgi:hypothetical protein